MPPATTTPQQIIIIGAGPVGMRAATEVLERHSLSHVILYSDEYQLPYNRVRLSELLAGNASLEHLNISVPKELQSRIELRMIRIVSIDTEQQHVLDQDGEKEHYDSLIIATGSLPFIPNIEGVHQTGVYTFRNIRDAEHLQARSIRTHTTVIIGAGLLGLEAARAMQKNNTKVIVIEQASHIMYQQLDESAASTLQQSLEKKGLEFINSARVNKILGDNRVTGVQLRDHSEIECDTVIIAAGISPNITLAKASGLHTLRGVVVNDQLQTSAKNVFAVGECAEHKGKVYGLVAPGYEQAAVAAQCLNNDTFHYSGSQLASHLKVLDEQVFSLGKENDIPSHVLNHNIIFEDAEKGIYRKLIFLRNQLIGCIAVGEWDDIHRIQEAINSQRTFFVWSRARFKKTGSLWAENESKSVNEWPSTTKVCNCTGVTRGQLTQAIEIKHCKTTEELTQCTGASSICGSCKPLLAEMLGSFTKVDAIKWASTILITAIISLLLLIAYVFTPSVPHSMQYLNITIETLWTDSLYKQISGFTILGFMLLSLLLSLRKRIRRFQWGNFAHYRLLHNVLGALALFTLFMHTGIQFGEQLNFWLMFTTLTLITLGALTSILYSQLHKLPVKTGKRLKESWVLVHIIAFWPLPVLLSFHILSAYYF